MRIFIAIWITAILRIARPTEGQLVKIPDLQPDVGEINSTFLFRHKGELHPILNYVHIRTTVSLANLSAGVHAICNTAEEFKKYTQFHKAERTLFPNGTENMGLRRYKGGSDQTRWSTPIFVVPKKNGEFRLVSDLRKVNEVLEDDFLPSKPVLQLLGEIQSTRSRYFSTMDIQSAFFSIRYSPGTNFPTAFYADCGTHLNPGGRSLMGKYIYKRLVMGCQSSSAALFRVMSYVLRDIPGCKVYCDDIIVYSQTEEEHLAILQAIFQRCAKYGIKLAPNKCGLLKEKIIFLGFHASKDGISPEVDKLKKIRDYASPTTITEIRSAV